MLILLLAFPAIALMVAGLLVAGGIVAAHIFRRRKQKTGGFRLPLVIAGCASLPFGGLLALLFVVPAIQAWRPAAWDFEEGFGWAPGPEIQHLRGRTDAGVDSRTIYIAFDGTPPARNELIKRLRGSIAAAENDGLDSDIYGGNAPSWFNAASPWVKRHSCTRREYSGIANWNAWHEVVIVDCRSDGRIYAMFQSID